MGDGKGGKKGLLPRLSFAGAYRYLTLVVLSLCLWRYSIKFQQMHNIVEVFDSGLAHWTDALQARLDISLPRFGLKQWLGPESAGAFEAALWAALTYLPFLGLLNIRKQLLLYWLFNALLLALVFPAYPDDFERFFFDNHEKLVLVGVCGYVYNM